MTNKISYYQYYCDLCKESFKCYIMYNTDTKAITINDSEHDTSHTQIINSIAAIVSDEGQNNNDLKLFTYLKSKQDTNTGLGKVGKIMKDLFPTYVIPDITTNNATINQLQQEITQLQNQ